MATLLKTCSFSGHQPWEKSKAMLILSICPIYLPICLSILWPPDVQSRLVGQEEPYPGIEHVSPIAG